MVYAVLLTVMNSNNRGHAASHYRGSRSSSSYYRQSSYHRRQKNRMRGALSRSQSAVVHPVQEPSSYTPPTVASCSSYDTYIYQNQSGLDSEDDTEESIGMMPISYYTESADQQRIIQSSYDTIGECDASAISNTDVQSATPRSRWKRAVRWVLESLRLSAPANTTSNAPTSSLPAAQATPLPNIPMALPFADRIRRFSASSDTDGTPTAVAVTSSTFPYR